MNSNKYKNLKEILFSLNQSIDALENGQLNVDQLAVLLQDARELHERIAILQYLSVAPKTSVQEVKEEIELPKVVEPERKPMNFTFAFEEEVKIPTNQTSLLDAIQQESKEEELKTKPVEVEKVVEKSIEIFEEITIEKEVIHEVKEVAPIKQEMVKPVAASINDKFSGQVEKVTLADKLSKKPISNLVEAIGLNQKFLFMNDLFEGENNHYKEAITTINNFSNFTEANDFLKSLSNRHSWDANSHTLKEFVDLVERRFLG